MIFASTLQRLHASLVKSAGTVVFGMEDGTVSIFGLIFGVAATTSSRRRSSSPAPPAPLLPPFR